MRLLGTALLVVLLAQVGLASAAGPVKELGSRPAADSLPGADADGVWRFYRAAPIQRTLARWVGVLSGALLLVAIVTLMRGFLGRIRAGLPLRYGYLVVLAAPAMLLAVGLWIGWGQTRIDLERATVEIRPLGIPWPAEVHRLGEADRLVIVSVPGVSSGQVTGGPATSPGTFWHVRLEGPGLDMALKVQLGSEAEALGLAERLGERLGVPVEAPASSQVAR